MGAELMLPLQRSGKEKLWIVEKKMTESGPQQSGYNRVDEKGIQLFHRNPFPLEYHLHDLQAQHESDDKHEAVIAHRKGAYFEDFHIRIPINACKDHTLVLLVNVKKSLQSAREFLFEILFFFRHRIIS